MDKSRRRRHVLLAIKIPASLMAMYNLPRANYSMLEHLMALRAFHAVRQQK